MSDYAAKAEDFMSKAQKKLAVRGRATGLRSRHARRNATLDRAGRACAACARTSPSRCFPLFRAHLASRRVRPLFGLPKPLLTKRLAPPPPHARSVRNPQGSSMFAAVFFSMTWVLVM